MKIVLTRLLPLLLITGLTFATSHAQGGSISLADYRARLADPHRKIPHNALFSFH